MNRLLARLPVRLLAFNLLLVFLPIGGVMYLGAYEKRLETAEMRSMTEQARLVATSIGKDGRLDAIDIDEFLHRTRGTVRFRIVDANGFLVADSKVLPTPRRVGSVRRNTLYRVVAFLARPFLRQIRPPQRLEIDFYDNATRLYGPEVQSALKGREGFEKKISAGGARSVTLYRAAPIRTKEGRVIGAVVASQSTYTILQDLYAVRLGVVRIFVATLIVATIVTIFFATTIVRPLRQLRLDARSILDRRGRLRGHFKGSNRLDEIGELSRALERIMRRLDSHVKLVETFASDVSHEFKNPLASIRTANEMLAEVNDPADRRRFARMVEQEVARMEKLLAGVREISLIDAQLGQEERQRVAITPMLEKIVEGFRLREGERIRLDLDASKGLFVEGSEERYMQVFENVLDNAASFSPNGGAVRIEAFAMSNDVVARIIDEGPGIPAHHMQKIFDRFFTYRPSQPPRNARHTGLGLAIVKAIVEGYGGTITAANAARGAVFQITLPRASAAP
ncbi:MAG: HAMP domain-containing protein [Acidobacteria bacterium]|nr:HAMP domain-containing protein [Acidobacteriota bacterium]